MKKTACLFAISLFLTAILMFSCGGGGGADNAIDDTSFTIGYNENGAESGTAPKAQSGNGKEVLSVSANTGSLAKDGYLFDGWNTQPDGYGADYAPGALYNGKNITLYAKWAALFNYNVINPGSPAPALDGAQMSPGIPTASITGLTARGMTLSDISIPKTIDGYPVVSIGNNAFQGCTNVSSMLIPDTVTEIGDNAFNGCSNLSGITMQGTTPPSVGADAFAGCVLLAVSVPQSAASTYNSSPSWSTVAILAPGTFSIVYNGNGSDGGIVPQRQVGMTGITIQIYGNNGSLTRIGCTFNGWNTKADGKGNSFAEDSSYAGPDNMTLYSQWTHPDYTVTFDGDGANTQASPQNIAVKAPANTIASLPSVPPKKDGFYFGGWYTQRDGAGSPFVAGSQVINNMTVYAKWTLRPDFTVTYDDQEATTPAGQTSKVVVAPKTTVEELPTAPAKTGYNFGGWYTEPNGRGTQFTAETVVNDNITVYAKWETYNYIVTFNSQGATTGAVPSSKTVTTPATKIDSLPTVPEKNGYYFGGWFTQTNGKGSIFDANTPVTGNITVYAKWTLEKTYTVNFDSRGAEIQANPASKTVVTPATKIDELPSEPIKTGYTFGGWFTGTNGSGTQFTADTTINANKTVYAKWTANTYQITYKDKNGAAFSGVHGQNYPSSHTYGRNTTLVSPSKTGYLFGGWYDNSSCTGEALTKITATAFSDDITLYAKWDYYEYTVTFDSQGATTGANPASKQVVSPALTVGELPTDPIKTGYTFGGWFAGTNGSGSRFTADTTITSNKTVYAYWLANTYQITYKDKGGSAFSGTHGNYYPILHTYGRTTTLVNPTKECYLFGGWYDNSSCTGEALTKITATAYSEDITLYAKWNEYHYAVTFDGQGATTEADPTSKTVSSPATTIDVLPEPPAKTGYTFGGWYNQPGGAGEEFTTNTVVTGNTTVYAKWNNYNYTVTFSSPEATTSANPTSKPVASPDTTIVSLPKPPIRTGYAFGGWYNQPEGAGGEFTTSTIVTGNTTVYAKWNEYNYTVTFDGQGATIEATPASKTVVTPATKIDELPTDPIKTGYTFGGWYTGTNGSGTRFTEGITVNANMTVYAKWTANTYQISYKDEGGTSFSGIHGSNYPTSHTYGSNTALVNPTNERYLFGGWYTNSACTGEAITAITATAYSEDITLYAKWVTTPRYSSTSGNRSGASVGDIVFANGKTATPTDYSSIASNYQLESGSPVGVVAYVGTSTAGEEGIKYMVGLIHGPPYWCSSSSVEGYQEMSTTNSGYYNTYSVIGKLADYNSSNYPAFGFAIDYSVTGYNSGWFLPSINELNAVYNKRISINIGINAIKDAGGKAVLINGEYLSSSQYDEGPEGPGRDEYAYYGGSDGTGGTPKKNNSSRKAVFVVRALDD